jgi:hypothetical protein
MNTVNNIVNEITRDKRSKSYYTNKYPCFFVKYPLLCNAIFDPTTDFSILRHMLNLQTDMSNGVSTKEQAETNMGSLLVDTYIKPKLKKNHG